MMNGLKDLFLCLKTEKEEFKKFCEWNGFDLTNLIDLFIEYEV